MSRMYTRQGYLFLQGKKNLKLATGWTKHYCQYQAKTKTLTLIPLRRAVLGGGGEDPRPPEAQALNEELRGKWHQAVFVRVHS